MVPATAPCHEIEPKPSAPSVSAAGTAYACTPVTEVAGVPAPACTESESACAVGTSSTTAMGRFACVVRSLLAVADIGAERGSCCFYFAVGHGVMHSFPIRRSSDLLIAVAAVGIHGEGAERGADGAGHGALP